MDAISTEALASLSSTITALLPTSADPALTPTVAVALRRLTPTGVGAFVGFHPEPQGEIVGRRLEATALVTARGSDSKGLADAVSAVTAALLGQDRATMAGQGLLRLSLQDLGLERPEGNTTRVQRELAFDVLYEFLKRPTTAGGIIQRIPIDLVMGTTGNTRRLLSTGFSAGSLSLFDVIDDPAATTAKPSQWAANGTEERIEQTSLIRGGTTGATPRKPGTYLVLKSTPALPPVADFALRTTLRSGSSGGIGLVFRFQDADNFLFFLMDSSGPFRLLGKKVGGTFSALESPGVDAAQGFDTGRLYDLKITAAGPDLQVFLDDKQILAGSDSTLTGAGRVGFMTRNNDAAFFFRISLVQF
jgi:hypothetical protein